MKIYGLAYSPDSSGYPAEALWLRLCGGVVADSGTEDAYSFAAALRIAFINNRMLGSLRHKI